MCGIAGLWTAPGDERARAVVETMGDRLSHRGPDDHGSWTDLGVGIALAHRRLAIVDLSPLGHQPMMSPSGRYVIVFNGEIYNHSQLRRELLNDSRFAFGFRGHSDTEVMLAAIEAWGCESAVGRFVGMFAFALWDRQHRELLLVRDRLGIKPLYYGWAGKTFVFGSELNAITTHPDFRAEIDREALALLMRHSSIPAPHCIYRGIYKLLPGTILTITSPERPARAPVAFWSAKEIAERGVVDPFRGSDDEAVRQLDLLLREAVAQRMVADVPLGAFLSGGIDSSTVVALMQSQTDQPVKTFSIGSFDDDHNEAQYAKAVARHLGTDHTELYVTPQDALAVIPKLPTLYDEPFSDSSQIPTFLVSKLAREHVTIALSGDGGDELFAGYNRHVWVERLWNIVRRIPPQSRRASGRAIAALSPNEWDLVFATLRRVFPNSLNHRGPGEKLHKIAGILSAPSPEAMYRRLASHWNQPEFLVLGANEPLTRLTDPAERVDLSDHTDVMLYLDLVTYLPDDILTKVDRASMAVGLEARVPILDHRVVEFAWQIPRSLKIRNGQGKWLLRQVLHRYVPEHLVERPKSGFGIPIGNWLRGPLRSWAEALLDKRRLLEEGFFNPDPIRKKWAEHLTGRKNWQYHLWDVLMFQAWHEEYQPTIRHSDEVTVLCRAE
jgi:asparagine synthase (glutamine-hydrolysing)